MKKNKASHKGGILIVVLSATAIFLVVLLGSLSLAVMQIKLYKQKTAQSHAFHIAEAGINNYRWMLYHDEKHYFDTAGCGYDIDCSMGTTTYNNPFDPSPSGIKGAYNVVVHTPKKNGSSVITVRSTGWTDAYPQIKKTIEVSIGKKSWASYSILSNAILHIESGNNVRGKIHSNSGVRMDGIANNVVSASVKKYFDPLHCGAEEYGVHTHTYEIDPNCDCPTEPNSCDRDERYDDAAFLAGTMPVQYLSVFPAGRSFPVPVISFNTLSNNISEMMSLAAEADGQIIDSSTNNCGISGDCSEGFQIVLNDNNYTLFGVDGTNCGGFGITGTNNFGSFTYPANGIILVNDRDKLWIEGNIENNRVSVLLFNGAIEQGNADIIISGDITYSNNDGSEALGLIAQRNIEVDRCIANNNLEINAAMITKKGSILANGVDPIKNSLTINGSIAAYNGFDFYEEVEQTCCNTCKVLIWWVTDCLLCGSYDCSTETGFNSTSIEYDSNLDYNPPPHFPTTGEYRILSWKEE